MSAKLYSVPDKRFYGDDEAEQILKLAARKSPASGSMSREQLLATASELGISPEALDDAEREYRETYQLEIDRKAFNRHIRFEFLGHLLTFLVVNAGLVYLDMRHDGRLNWAFWCFGFWGLSLLSEGYKAFATSGSDYEKSFTKWRRKSGSLKNERVRTVDTSAMLDDIAGQIDVQTSKLEAIKMLRERSGLGLAESKEAVDEYLGQRS